MMTKDDTIYTFIYVGPRVYGEQFKPFRCRGNEWAKHFRDMPGWEDVV